MCNKGLSNSPEVPAARWPGSSRSVARRSASPSSGEEPPGHGRTGSWPYRAAGRLRGREGRRGCRAAAIRRGRRSRACRRTWAAAGSSARRTRRRRRPGRRGSGCGLWGTNEKVDAVSFTFCSGENSSGISHEKILGSSEKYFAWMARFIC